jgi:hypothetical protein
MRKLKGSAGVRIGFSIAIAVGVAIGLSSCSSSGTSTSATSLSRTDVSDYNYTGEVYLLRGLANVFSTGLDQLNGKFRARGVNSKVDNHSLWQAYADDIVSRSKSDSVSYPIVIMGHSLGGNASVQMAKYLGDRGIPVSYVVAFDPTITTSVGPNVTEVVNYYIPNKVDGNATNIVKEEPGSNAEVSNVDVRPIGVDHFNVEKNPQLQVQVMTKAIGLMTPRRKYVAGQNK